MLLSACVTPREAALSVETPTAAPTPLPTSSPVQATPTFISPTATRTPAPTLIPTPTHTPPMWRVLAPGISQTFLAVSEPGAAFSYPIYVLRLDPARVTFRIYYDRDEPHTIAEWLTLTEADVVVNGGFFTGDHRPVGRLVIDGELFGAPLDPTRRIGIAGLFAVIDHTVQIYALGRSSYTPRGMRFDQAVESYPLLVLPGRQPAYPPDRGRRARRTVIGIDEQGDVILILIDNAIFSLYELAQWLASCNLNLDTALNLDGGRSSGLGVALPGEERIYEAYVPLPIVIAVSRR